MYRLKTKFEKHCENSIVFISIKLLIITVKLLAMINLKVKSLKHWLSINDLLITATIF